MVQPENGPGPDVPASLTRAVRDMGSQPLGRVQHALQTNPGLVKRLSHTQSFKGHGSVVSAIDWSSNGEILLSGSEDCRVKLWSVESGLPVHSFDSGHTSSIYVAKFMLNTGNDQIITSAADRQVRLVNLHRSAIKPYTFHHGRVKALVPMDPFMFISGSDDGTVRHYDTREAASTSSIPGTRTGDVLADQRHERSPRGRAKVSISAMAVDPMRPHLFVTGGSDPLVRLYDRRMSGQRGHMQSPTGRCWPQYVSCFIPTSLKTDSGLPRPGNERVPFVTSVKFSVGGEQVLASYSGDHIYSFDCVDHARDSEAYCNAQGWSRPSSAFGTRSASRHAVLHASAAANAVSDGHDVPQGAVSSLPAEAHQQQTTTATQTDAINEIAEGNMPASSIPTSAAGIEDPDDHPGSSGGITPAAAAAVARIRARRAARAQGTAHLHPSSSPAPAADTNPAPVNTTAADSAPPLAQLPSTVDHSNFSVPSTSVAALPNVRGDLPDQHHMDAAAHSRHQDPLAESSGRSVQATADAARDNLHVERMPSAPRPPLPFHAIRRSARLHKSAGRTLSGPSDQAARDKTVSDTVADTAAVGSPPATDADSAGPCTRHSCKRKLAEMSDAAAAASEQAEAAPYRRHHHVAASQLPHAAVAGPADVTETGNGESQLVGQPHSCRQADDSTTADIDMDGVQEADVTNNQNGAAPGRNHADPPPGLYGNMLTGSHPARSLRHCSSLRSVADAAHAQQLQQSHAGSDAGRAGQGLQQPGQHAQPEDDSLNAQHEEACVASSRRLEQPTASTGTSRPVPLGPVGVSMQTSHAGESAALAPPEFLRLQYSTDPPSSANNSREGTPDQAAVEVTQPAQHTMQVQAQAAGTGLEFPHPSRRTRRARASRLAPLPATSAAHVTKAACASLPPLDPPDIVSRHNADEAAGQSQACSHQDFGPAVSASTEAKAGSGNDLDDADAEPRVQQPREGTPVSSNRCHYRARGRASVEASNAPRAPMWHPSSSMLAAAEPSSGNSPRGSYNHSIPPASCEAGAERQEAVVEAAGPAEEEVVSPHQSGQSQAETSPQLDLGGETESPHQGRDGDPSCSYAQPAVTTAGAQGSLAQRAAHLPDAGLPFSLGGSRTMTSRPVQQPDNGMSPQHGRMAQANSCEPHPVAPHVRRRRRSSVLRRTTSHATPPLRSDSAVPGQPGSTIQESGHQASRAAADGPHRATACEPSRAEANVPDTAAANSLNRANIDSPDADSAPGPSHSSEGRHADHSCEGRLQQQGSHGAQMAGAVDSFVGAIMQAESDNEGDSEVVDERGMFQQCYKGHCNLSLNKEVCLMGSRDEFVASGSDDGRIFIWDRINGRLINMLTSDDQNVTCVTAHPSMPVLASAGSEPIIKLWSPQAEFACNLDRAEAITSHNAQELAEGDRRSNLAGPPPMWLNMLGTAVSAELRTPGEAVPARATNPVRCSIM